MGKIERLDLRRKPQEQRITQAASETEFIQFFGLDGRSLGSVTVESALQVPAVLCARAFLSRTLAALPLHVFRKTADGSQKVNTGIGGIIHRAPNEETTSFKWRQYFWEQVFSSGRGLSWIERGANGAASSLWNFDSGSTEIRRADGRTTYKRQGKEPYLARDVIDIPFMFKADGLGHYGPIGRGSGAISLAIAMADYCSGFFQGGGVPPLAVKGPMPAGQDAIKRAQKDIAASIQASRESGVPITNLPAGYELVPVGFDPEKGQMTEARRFQIEEVARLFQLPPVFLQDLTHGTFSNTEQQDLHLVKHVIAQWAEAFEQELNLKLFGQRNSSRYVKHNLDGLLRGDFATRMAGIAQGVQNGVLTPNEGRALDERPALPHGDDLMIQGATVPIGQVSQQDMTNEP